MTVVMRIRHGARRDPDARADFATPQVIRDALPDLWSPVDGKPQTSKRAYYRQLRENGLEIVDQPRIRDRNGPGIDTSDLKADIAAALRQDGPHVTDIDHIPELD